MGKAVRVRQLAVVDFTCYCHSILAPFPSGYSSPFFLSFFLSFFRCLVYWFLRARNRLTLTDRRPVRRLGVLHCSIHSVEEQASQPVAPVVVVRCTAVVANSQPIRPFIHQPFLAGNVGEYMHSSTYMYACSWSPWMDGEISTSCSAYHARTTRRSVGMVTLTRACIARWPVGAGTLGSQVIYLCRRRRCCCCCY